MRQTLLKIFMSLAIGVLTIAALVVACVVLWTRSHPEAGAAQAAGEESAKGEISPIAVYTIRPKRDPSFTIFVEEPAYIDAYYQAELESRVPGMVKFLAKDKGDPVKKGELLLKIDVPDLIQEVLQKESIIEQRKREQELSEANERMARAAVAVAQNEIAEKEFELAAAEDTRDFRERELRRFETLASGDHPAVTPDVVDERRMFYQSAEAAKAGCQAAILKAKSDLEEAKAKLDAASVDVKLKTTMIEVAGKDRDHSQALADYANIIANFDGVIVDRTVGPGSFVQSGATGHGDPLLTVARTDIVTVYMKVPDNFAPYMTRDTEALIEMSELPGQLIHGKVTRYPPSLRETDRTMRVEVDLYNGREQDYQALVAHRGNGELKGDVLPLFPKVTGPKAGPTPPPLLPGMVGKMRLLLRNFQNVYLVPSDVVVTRRGKPYIFVVNHGSAELRPVEVQVDDGNLAKIALISTREGMEIDSDLTGQEEIVASNQGEISEGQPLQVTPKSW